MQDTEELLKSLREAVDDAIRGERRVGVAFSGGLDSGIVAMLAAEALGRENVKCYALGVGLSPEESGRTHDIRSARAGAGELGLELVEISMSPDEVRLSADDLGSMFGIEDRFIISIELPLLAVASRAHERVILLGQGADELFGGYQRYLRMTPAGLRTALEKDASGLGEVVDRESHIAGRFRKEFRYPYLHPGVSALAERLPVERKVCAGQRKIILREAARMAGMPESLAGKEKKAAQYGSGTWRVLRPRSEARPAEEE